MPAAASVSGAGSGGAGSGTLAGPHELVTRPDGLRRGVWEGPSWMFAVISSLLVGVALAYGLRRIGLSRLRSFFGRKR